MKIIYEDLVIQDKTLLKNLDKVIDAIGYNTDLVSKSLFKPKTTEEHALSRVSEDALNEIMRADRPVATKDCNLYKFENVQFEFVKVIAAHIKDYGAKAIGLSGRIWYPHCGFMGWHTNSNNRGIRLYCTFSRESEKSFFRYRDPNTGEVITSWDKEGWNFRAFNIGDKPLWHSVFSMTDRFSIGYLLRT